MLAEPARARKRMLVAALVKSSLAVVSNGPHCCGPILFPCGAEEERTPAHNVQLAYTPYERGPTHVTIALERPGASPDAGSYAGRVELESVVTRFPAPDVSAHVRYGGSWGHVQAAGIFRYIT